MLQVSWGVFVNGIHFQTFVAWVNKATNRPVYTWYQTHSID